MFRKMKARSRLNYAFERGGLYREHGDYKTLPKVHSVEFFDERIEFVFTLPNGLDPKEMKKKEYVFRQVFGKTTEVRGDLKRFVINVYRKSLPDEIKYNFNELQPVIEAMKLPIVCGKNLNNDYVAYDMVGENRSSILIAGEPGAGKSTQLRQILCTLIQYLNPDQLRLHLADLKRSEFGFFRNVEHVEGVYVEQSQLLAALEKMEPEIERRGNLLDRSGKTHIDQLNQKLPYIVVCIDEYSLVNENKDIETLVQKVGSVGRALGIYLIISMQRPSHDLLATKIRALLSTRMGFRVADASNAKLMGTLGSEKITKAGRMICKIEAAEELQAPILKENDAEKILKKYKVTRVENKPPAQVEQAPIYGRLDEDD